MASKNLRIVTDDLSALVRIEWEGGGEVPLELSGMFTDTVEARKAINAYRGAKGRDIKVKDKTKQTVDEARQERGSGKLEFAEL